MGRRKAWLSALALGCSAGGGGLGGQGGEGSNGSAGSGTGGSSNLFDLSGNAGADVGGIDDRSKCGGLQLNTSQETVVQPGNVLIVFDQSSSMDSDFGGVPLWQATQQAVRDALAPNQANLTIGALFFPSQDDILSVTFVFPCNAGAVLPITQPPQIPFMPGPQFIQAWDQRWTAANLHTSTPLDAATVQADAALQGTSLVGPTVVIVVTDGEPTCQLAPGSVQLATQWASQGIPTYVIGLPGVLGGGVLTQLAQAGGATTDFFTPDDAAGLQAELQKIMGTVVRQSLNDCGIIFNETPENLSEVALVVTDGATGERYKIEQGPEGWNLRGDGSGADLTGTTCSEALNGRFTSISFEFGCEDIPVLR